MVLRLGPNIWTFSEGVRSLRVKGLIFFKLNKYETFHKTYFKESVDRLFKYAIDVTFLSQWECRNKTKAWPNVLDTTQQLKVFCWLLQLWILWLNKYWLNSVYRLYLVRFIKLCVALNKFIWIVELKNAKNDICMSFKDLLKASHIPVNTQRRFNVDTTLFGRQQRYHNVKMTSCAYWELKFKKNQENLIG